MDEKIHFSMIVATKRGIDELKPLFRVTDENTELVIVDSNYNENTKKWLSKQKGYEQVIYAPVKEEVRHYMRDFSQALNTALLYSENGWIIRADDSLELKDDFFTIARHNINTFPSIVGNEAFAFIGQKLWASLNHERWNDYYSKEDPSRYINVTDPRFTYSFGVYPIDMVYNLNGYDERYDCGWGYEDLQFLHRLLLLGYKVFYDRIMMGYSEVHKQPPHAISPTEILYHFDVVEISSGKLRAYNPFNLKMLHPDFLAKKEDYKVC
jgi:hypothetical protein